MTLLRSVIVALALAFAGAIFWASSAADLSQSFYATLADPWGLVMLLDLYFGFILFSGVIWVFEPNKAVAAIMIVATFGLGNIIPAAWLAWRGVPALRRAARAV